MQIWTIDATGEKPVWLKTEAPELKFGGTGDDALDVLIRKYESTHAGLYFIVPDDKEGKLLFHMLSTFSEHVHLRALFKVLLPFSMGLPGCRALNLPEDLDNIPHFTVSGCLGRPALGINLPLRGAWYDSFVDAAWERITNKPQPVA